MAMYEVSLRIGFVGAVHRAVIEVNDEELAACKTEEEKENLLQEYWQDWANSYIDGGINEA